MIAKVGPNLIVLRAPVKLSVSADSTVAEFDVSAGERVAFVTSYENSHERQPAPIDAEFNATFQHC